MKVIADGDLTSTVEGTIRRDEIGSMARAVQIFRDNELGARDLGKDAETSRGANEESTTASTALALEAKQLRGIVAEFQIENALSEQQTSQSNRETASISLPARRMLAKVANELGKVSDGRVADRSRQ
nr:MULTISPECIES: HAMP domain-containing protein [Rhizobium]